jgi:hypothetical protein
MRSLRAEARYSEFVMKYAALTLTLLIISLGLANAQKPAGQSKTLVYYEVSGKPSAFDRDAKNAYAGKFRFIDIKKGDGFTPGYMKGGWPYHVDPRPEREEAVPGKVVIVWVVTPEGSVIEPRILQSTDNRVADFMINRIALRRFVPARVRGIAVFRLWSDEFVFGSDRKRARDSSLFKDGLGIQGQRDR